MEIRLKTCSVIVGVVFCVHIIHHITCIGTIIGPLGPLTRWAR